VPAGPIHDDNGVTAGGDVAADFREVAAHGVVVGARHDKGGADTALRRDRAKHVG